MYDQRERPGEGKINPADPNLAVFLLGRNNKPPFIKNNGGLTFLYSYVKLILEYIVVKNPGYSFMEAWVFQFLSTDNKKKWSKGHQYRRFPRNHFSHYTISRHINK